MVYTFRIVRLIALLMYAPLCLICLSTQGWAQYQQLRLSEVRWRIPAVARYPMLRLSFSTSRPKSKPTLQVTIVVAS